MEVHINMLNPTSMIDAYNYKLLWTNDEASWTELPQRMLACLNFSVNHLIRPITCKALRIIPTKMSPVETIIVEAIIEDVKAAEDNQ